MAWAGGLLLLAALLLGLQVAATWWRRLRRAARISASIPGPEPSPLFGNFFNVRFGKLQDNVEDLIRQYGYLFRIWFGPTLLVFVLDAEDIEVVTSAASVHASGSKPEFGYSIVRELIGEGLVTMNGAEHRRHRKLIMPSLHREVLDQYTSLMVIDALALVENFQPKAVSGEVFNATPMCAMVGINSAFRTTLSADSELFARLDDRRRVVAAGIERQSRLMLRRVTRPWLLVDALFRLTPDYDDYDRLSKQYDGAILDVMAHRDKGRSGGGTPPNATSMRRRQAFLDLMLASEGTRSWGREELLGEVKTFVAASSVTSMDSLATQLLMLSLLPDVQAKIHLELNEVFGLSDRPLEVADLEHLEYLERFIKEALRYYPPFPVFGRSCTQDLPLPSGHTVPADSIIIMSPLATHHNPKYFPEPKRFDPDRWLPEAVAARPACSFLAFSAGPRNCIGGRYAVLFLKTCLATVLRRFTVLPDPDGPQEITKIRMRMGLTYFPRDGCRIRVRAREPAAEAAAAAVPG